MAKFRAGPLVGEIRNSIGSTTFSRNQSGPYIRIRKGSANFPTTSRLAQQARMTAADAAWNDTLTDSQRTAWEAYAQVLSKKLYKVGGRGIGGRPTFISSHLNLSNIGAATLTNPPSQPRAGAVTGLTLAVNSDTETLTLDGQIPPSTPDQGVIIFAAPPFSASRHFVWPYAVQIAALAPGWAFPLSLWDEYIAANPLPFGGGSVTLFAKPVATSSGLPGVVQSARALDAGTSVPMRIKTTTFTDAQIKALPTTPLSIVPAVAGRVIVPFMVTVDVNASAGAYTNVTAGISAFFFTIAGASKSARLQNDTMLSGATKRFGILPTKLGMDAIPPTTTQLYAIGELTSAVQGVALALQNVNAAGNFTGGNAANSMTVTVWYDLVTPL